MSHHTLIAEWEHQEFVQLVFPHKDTDWNQYLNEAIATFVNIAKTIQKYQKVVIIAKELAQTKALFPNKKNITFVKIDSNDTWSRDFGGICVKHLNQFMILDFKFNGWGNKFQANLDNKITFKMKLKGLFKNYQYKTIPFVLEGGAIDYNGNDILLTSSKTMFEKNRNPHLTKSTIEKKLIDFFGLKKILWLNYGGLSGDDTDSHIDTLARFVSKNTIVYQTCYKNNPDYEQLQKMEQELKKFKNLQNQHFQLIPLPPIDIKLFQNEQLPATYVNFLIINGAVLVPTYNDKNDKNALKIFKKLFPNRDIIGINCTTLIKQHGSLHCVTMQYPAIT